MAQSRQNSRGTPMPPWHESQCKGLQSILAIERELGAYSTHSCTHVCARMWLALESQKHASADVSPGTISCSVWVSSLLSGGPKWRERTNNGTIFLRWS